MLPLFLLPKWVCLKARFLLLQYLISSFISSYNPLVITEVVTCQNKRVGLKWRKGSGNRSNILVNARITKVKNKTKSHPKKSMVYWHKYFLSSRLRIFLKGARRPLYLLPHPPLPLHHQTQYYHLTALLERSKPKWCKSTFTT